MHTYQLAPSILSADFTRLGDEVRQVLAAGADRIHFDVMDNHYVPNLTFGPLVCEALRKAQIIAPIDVHLMTSPVDDLIISFAKAGATSITIHPEATLHLHRSLSLIQDQGCQVGLALNPATPLTDLKYCLEQLDHILVMSVNPGFGGQKFINSSLQKISDIAKLVKLSGHHISIGVDGGINPTNIRAIADAGADTFIAGSAIFGTTDYVQTIKHFRDELAHATPPIINR
jgi:ribulose-phosphate 3-epimerase